MAALLCVTAVPGCKDVIDAIEAGENEAKSNEENLRRFKERQAERLRKRNAPFAEVAATPEEPAMELVAGSPAARLRAEIERRLACKDDRCKARVLEGIRSQAATLMPGLPKLLQGQGRAVRVEAIRLAGLFRHRPSVEGIGRAATMGDRTTRTEAVWALGAIGDSRGVQHLRRMLEFDNPPWLTVEMCKALGQIRAAGSLPVIAQIFDEGEVNTRTECVQAAGRLGTPDAAPFLLRAKGDRSPRVAEEAARAFDALPESPSKRKAATARKGETGGSGD